MEKIWSNVTSQVHGVEIYKRGEPTWDGVVVGVIKGGMTINETFPSIETMEKIRVVGCV